MDGETALKYVRSRHGCCGEGGDLPEQTSTDIHRSDQGKKLKKRYILIYTTIKSYNNYQTNVDSNLKVWK